ncbi:hypothetical protein K8I85_00445, partial [bacterium]|nr:hypothetical protein [bacterium]
PGHAALSILDRLSDVLRPHRIAFGLGLGTLTTGLGGPVRELDGSCFHQARRALEKAKRDGRWAVISGMADETGDPAEDVASPASAFERAANAILRLSGDIRAGWTDRQVEVIRQRRTTPLQKDVAQRLGVSPSVISEVLRAARHDAVREAEHAVEVLLNRAASPGSFRPPESGQ